MKNKHIRLIVELIAWTFFIGFPLLLFPSLKPHISEKFFMPALKGVILTHLLLIIYYYFNFYYALPRFYFKRKFNVYLPLTLFTLLVIILVLQTDRDFNPFLHLSVKNDQLLFVFSIFLRFILIFLLSLGFASMERLRKAEKEKLKTELSYLKAQINPHFLFNTLNSIYALTVKKSDAAPVSVTKLSAIMRYVISDAMHDFVSLDKEINYISSYIELEKLRLTSKVNLRYSVNGTPEGHQIAPLIFVPLIENAFKHGVSTTENSEIDIHIQIEEKQLKLRVCNIKVRTVKTNSDHLGIENVKKRLNLIYPGRHELKIEENENNFLVTLSLSLK